MTNQAYSPNMSDIEMDDFIADLGDLCDKVVMPKCFDETVKPVKSSFDLYWEGSVSQSIYDSVKAGRVVKIYV